MAVVVTLGGTDITRHILPATFRIGIRAFNRADNFNFTIRKRGSEAGITPAGNTAITVVDGATTIFNGTTVRIESAHVTENIVDYRVECKSREHELDRKMVLERIEDDTAENIIDFLIAKYAPGFTTAGVDANVDIKTIAFNRITLTECLDKIARLLNYQWYLDVDDDIHFFAKNSETSAFGVTDDNGNYIQGTLRITSDFLQIRNSITIQGGEALGEVRTEKLAGDGERDTFPLGNKFSSLPTIEVDGTPVDVGVDFLQNDAEFAVMWNFQQKYLRFTAGNIPDAPLSGETNIDVTGTPLYPILIQYADAASIASYGVRQFFIRDADIESRIEAVDRALAELEAYADSVQEGIFETYTAGLRPGAVINVNSVLLGVDEDFVIQSLTVTMEASDRLRYSVTLATLRTLGIIDVLQRQVFGDQLKEAQDETLLSFETLTDTFGITDGTVSITTTSPPYDWDTPRWGFFTWS